VFLLLIKKITAVFLSALMVSAIVFSPALKLIAQATGTLVTLTGANEDDIYTQDGVSTLTLAERENSDPAGGVNDGTYFVNWVGNMGDGNENSAIKFNVSSLGSTPVSSAKLRIYVSTVDTNGSDNPSMDVYSSSDSIYSPTPIQLHQTTIMTSQLQIR
jgi:hypothetical protein